MQKKLEADTETTRVNQQQRRWELVHHRRELFEATHREWEPKVALMEQRFQLENAGLVAEREGEVQNLQNQFLRAQLRYADRWRLGAETVSSWMSRINDFFRESQPAWSSESFVQGNWPRDPQNLIWKIGSSPIQLPLSEEAAECSSKLRAEGEEWPVAFDLLSHGALVLHGSPETESATDGVITNLLLRTITSLPAGAMRMTVIDPQGLGKKVSWLMSLADIDPNLVGDRVWTQPLHIADRLANIARSCEDIIQQSLRDKHANLYEYNLTAGPMAIPYRLIVWDQFPFGLDDSSWQSLCSILAAGGRCGVGVVLRLSSTHVWPSFADPRKLEEFGLHLELESDSGVARPVAARGSSAGPDPFRSTSQCGSSQRHHGPSIGSCFRTGPNRRSL